MGKYDPLGLYLRRHRQTDELVLSFTEIERMVGLLPKGAWLPEWWANETSGRSIQARAWLEAQRNASLVAGKERVVFRRCGADDETPAG